MITLDEIKKNLSAEIKMSGYSQTKIAKLLGVSRRNVSKYQHGTTLPALDTFANLCSALDLDANEVLGIKLSILP